MFRALERNSLEIRRRDRDIVERDERVATLSDTLQERQQHLNSLEALKRQAEAKLRSLESRLEDREKQIPLLKEKLAAAEQRAADRERTVWEMRNSRSWRLTAPYRTAGSFLRRTRGALIPPGVFTRAVVAALLLPSAFVYAGSSGALLSGIFRNSEFFREVLDNADLIRQCLLYRNRLYRRFVFATFSLALRIHRGGSVSRAAANLLRILRTEGSAGLRSRLLSTAPGAAPPNGTWLFLSR